MGVNTNHVVPAKAGTQIVTKPEGPKLRCFAYVYELDPGLRRNDEVGVHELDAQSLVFHQVCNTTRVHARLIL